MTFRVLEPGLLSTVQAEPRTAAQHLGVSAGGPMDRLSHRAANRLVGNPTECATLEVTLAGPTLEVLLDGVIALTGAAFPVTLEGEALPWGRPVRVGRGTELRLGSPERGCRAYLAVQGGISVPQVLGSRATDLRGRFGGHRGRALQAGDLLYRGGGMDRFPWLQLRGRATWVADSGDGLPIAPALDGPAVLRLVPGAHLRELSAEARKVLLDATYTVSPRSDRQGLRLLGPPLALGASVELLTEGVAFGTLQLPPDGQPILLMADRQSTGGYPRVGEVFAVDLPRAAQLAPGEPVRFTLGSLEEARALDWAEAQLQGTMDT